MVSRASGDREKRRIVAELGTVTSSYCGLATGAGGLDSYVFTEFLRNPDDVLLGWQEWLVSANIL
jgi:hypothetical protein